MAKKPTRDQRRKLNEKYKQGPEGAAPAEGGERPAPKAPPPARPRPVAAPRPAPARAPEPEADDVLDRPVPAAAKKGGNHTGLVLAALVLAAAALVYGLQAQPWKKADLVPADAPPATSAGVIAGKPPTPTLPTAPPVDESPPTIVTARAPTPAPAASASAAPNATPSAKAEATAAPAATAKPEAAPKPAAPKPAAPKPRAPAKSDEPY